LSSHQKDRLEKVQEVIAKLVETTTKGKPVIVEGRKDAEALIDLGVNGTILMLKTGGKPFFDFIQQVEELNPKEVILLLDYDRRGNEGTRRLQQELERLKIKVNLRFWIELHALVGHEVQCIESLPAYLGTLQQKTL
jgi:2,5-diamino-6-(ribosylamino)-4(3H)-pyrimidinone 5'-phosphate reductase